MENIRILTLFTAPRILGFINRDKNSKTYGCCDRNFWHYKLHDLSNARFQEACLFLVMLYNSNFEGNIYYRSKSVLDWALAVIDFWLSQSNKDASCVEIYPYERSFCATAFSTFAASESLLALLADNDGNTKKLANEFVSKSDVLKKLEKTGSWLSKNWNTDAANQMAAAALGLWNIFLLTGKQRYKNESEKAFNVLRVDVHTHGYFLEYGGFDLGYSSVTNSILSWYCDKVGDSREIIRIIETVNSMIEPRIDEFGNYDCSSTSRNTQFLYLYGAGSVKSQILKKVLRGISENKVITPLWMDDRYCTGMAIDYLKTYLGYLKTHAISQEVARNPD